VDLTRTATAAESANAHVAEILPRLGDVEAGLAALDGRVAELLDDEDELPPKPAPTPAMGWTAMSEAEARDAWEALAGWVDDVLCGEYRLSRAQLPDCWPVHPRAVRELAWLRTLHLATARHARRAPAAAAEWHTRWLPAAVTNLREAVDARECGPGFHRLTDDERRHHHFELEQAARGREPDPVLSEETGAERPRYLPDRFPPLRGRHVSESPGRQGGGPRPPSPSDHGADQTPIGPSGPGFWVEFYRDAAAEDLARRRARATADPTTDSRLPDPTA